MSTTATQSVVGPSVPDGGLTAQPSVTRIRPEDYAGEHNAYDLLREDNWQSWRDDIYLTFRVCDLFDYVHGLQKCPEKEVDPVGESNWKYNDRYTKKVIRDRLSEGQKYHTTNCDTSNEMWKNLEAIHQPRGDHIENELMRELIGMKAKDGENIVEHLAKLKQVWDRATLVCQDRLPIPTKSFKEILTYSLPKSCDDFTRQLSRGPDKKDMVIQVFIGECNEEYRRRLKRDNEEGNNGQSAYASKPSLINRLDKNQSQNQNRNAKRQHCTHCGRNNHTIDNCYHISKPKCRNCKRLGHKKDKCRFKAKSEGSNKQKDELVAEVIKPKAHIAEITDDQTTMIATAAEFTLPDDPFIDDEKDYQAHTAVNADSCMYDWLADSGSTTHITNQRQLFIKYESTPNAIIYGIGNNVTQALGRGVISLNAQYGERKTTINLEKVLYIPGNKYNILALGRWDTEGRKYTATDGALTLYDRRGTPVLTGQKLTSHLYKLRLTPNKITKASNKSYALSCTEPKQSWETWHRRFGHVSYKGLKLLFHKNLVDGFTVNTETPIPACISCIEAKQTVTPFDSATQTKQRNKGELTHIDLWGKYETTSINGHQYYLLLVDDATRYVTVYFLMTKDEASHYIQYHLAYLHVRGISTHALRVDRGTEFVNETLITWCQKKGMELQITAPYSPSQNGVAERMNHTLVELARAMLTASKLPEFLWETAVAHAAYVRNRSYAVTIDNKTPYEGWHGNKPNVAHLREFGTNVWVLLQGQNVARKILQKSKRRAYVGYNDDPKSVIYYNTDTRRCLTSRNYKFLTLAGTEF